MINFTVVRAPSHYNVILGRTGLRTLRAVSLTIHSMVKFPTSRGITTLVNRTMIISECRRLEKKQMIKTETSRGIPPKGEPHVRVDLTEQILVNPTYPNQMITIGGNLSEGCKNQLKALLKKSMDVFAWEPADMTFEEWVKAGIVHPVKYPTWISNPVLVKKIDKSWRMCIAFKNLNSACPKDYYPLPDINEKIKYIMLHEDALRPQECQSYLSKISRHDFQSQIERNLEAYVDDMVIKSNDEKVLIADIAETFDNLRRINMKLNPKKCLFGVEEGKFLGYMEMQSLSGKLAALKRFFSRSTERSLPFFETFKDITKESKDEYRWTKNAEKAFQEMKRVIVELPSLTTPTKEEMMTLNDIENNYAPLEKLALSLLHMLRRLRRIRSIQHSLRAKKCHKRSGTGRLLVRSSSRNPSRRILLSTGPNAKQECMERWTLFMDGASNSKGFEASLVLISLSGVEFTYALRLNFTSTNNEAEYEALLAGLRLAKKMKVIPGGGIGLMINRLKEGKHDRRGGRRQLDDAHHTMSSRGNMAKG
ncbi:reverse transcriptase domain-containing protein [Tanacetum coccineum]